MKILQINNVYDFGSTGKITADLHREMLAQGIESVVCYGRRQKTQDPQVYKTCGEFESHVQHLIANVTGLMYGGCGPSTARLIRIIQREQPDLVHLQCLNGYFVNIYRLLGWLKAHRIKTVLTLHAEFMYTANCGHALDCEKWKTGCGQCPDLRSATGSYGADRTAESWRRMQQAFAGFEQDLTAVSVSPWLMNRAQQSPVLQGFDHRVIYNGIDTGIFQPVSAQELRKKHGLEGKTVLLHVSPRFTDQPDHLKGGSCVLELARRMPNAEILVAGPHEITGSVPENVTLLGPVLDQKLLAQYYSLADATVLTSKRETFSMVCAESLCCGTPVAGFLAGGPEMISLPEYSCFVPWGQMEQLESAAQKMICTTMDSAAVQRAASVYSRQRMTQSYCGLYREILQAAPGQSAEYLMQTQK